MPTDLNLTAKSLACLVTCGIGSAWADDGPGLADRLSAAGVTPSVTYEGDVAANTAGGQRRGSTYSDILHVQLSFAGDSLTGVQGLSAYLDGLWINGGQPSKLAGDAQGVSNIAAPAAVRLYEAWLQYNFPGNAISVLAGRYDLNTEFYRLNSADLFLNSSFGIGPEFGLSGFGGTSTFPDTSVGIRLGYKPSLNTVLRVAVLDAAPLDRHDGSPDPFNSRDGALIVAEAAWLTRPSISGEPTDHRLRIGRHGTPLPYDDKIAIGVWYYTATFNDLTGPSSGGATTRHSGEGGGYVLFDRLLVQSRDDPKRRLTGFLQFGAAQQEVDRFGTYVGVGVAFSGLLPGRPEDEAGLGVAMARNGSSYIQAQQQSGMPVNAAETSVELTWLAPVTAWLALQPDLQYVIHPDTETRLHNATVAQLRFELTF